jgi:fructose-specific phosphotransferase system component IIB
MDATQQASSALSGSDQLLPSHREQIETARSLLFGADVTLQAARVNEDTAMVRIGISTAIAAIAEAMKVLAELAGTEDPGQSE